MSVEAGLEPVSPHLLSKQYDVLLIERAPMYLGTGLRAFTDVTSFNLLKHLLDALHS